MLLDTPIDAFAFSQSFHDVAWPEIEAYDSGLLDVGDGHSIYYEQSGNPAGLPLVFLHGGPGNGVRPWNRRYYDPAFWRIVMLDQRGCGRSVPHGEMRANTTAHLIADIEKLRRHLGIARWLVAGGSWGSYLSLAYGEAHPQSCLGFLLRGIWLGTQQEVDWWWRTGIRRLYPDRWEEFVAPLTQAECRDPLSAYHARLMDPDPDIHMAFARRLAAFSGWTASFAPTDTSVTTRMGEPAAMLALARSFAHYCKALFFMAEDQLMRDLGRIQHLPAIIVNGRNDIVTPPYAAHRLHRAWPGSELVIVNAANHNIQEPFMAKALVDAAERLKPRLAETEGHR